MRLQGNRQCYQTVDDHMPPHKLFFANWDAERFINWGKQTGPSCAQVISCMLDRAVIEQHAYRGCFGVLSLRDKYGSKRLEQACALLLTRSQVPSYSQVKRTLEKGEDLKEKDKDNTDPIERHRPRGFQRGSQYFGSMAKREGGESDVKK